MLTPKVTLVRTRVVSQSCSVKIIPTHRSGGLAGARPRDVTWNKSFRVLFSS